MTTRLLALLVLAAGCQAPEMPIQPTVTDLTIWVVEYSRPPVAPLAGARVIVKPASGEAVQGISGPDGKLVLSVALGDEPALVTATAAAHSAHAMIDVTPANVAALPGDHLFSKPGQVVMYLARNAPDVPVKLSGALSNKLAAANAVTLTTLSSADSFQSPANSYELPIESGKPFSLVGLEWKRGSAPTGGLAQEFLRWFQIDRPAMTSDTRLDIDLATQTALTPKTGTVKLTIPGGTTGPLADADFPYVFVLLQNGSGFLGAPTKIGPSAMGPSFEGELSWVQPNGVSADQLRYRSLISSSDGSYANHARDEAPPAALVVDDFLLPPVVRLSSAQPGTAIAFTNWPDPNPGVCGLDVYGSEGTTSRKYELWISSAAKGKTEVVVPSDLPADVRAALAPKTLEGRLECRQYDSDGKGYRSTGSRWIDLSL